MFGVLFRKVFRLVCADPPGVLLAFGKIIAVSTARCYLAPPGAGQATHRRLRSQTAGGRHIFTLSMVPGLFDILPGGVTGEASQAQLGATP